MAQSKIDYVESPLDRIVGVHWAGGLAVHFDGKGGPPVEPVRGRLTRGSRPDELSQITRRNTQL
jgi:hypothetical protein